MGNINSTLETRICKKCNQELDTSNFYFRKEKNDYRSCCKKCKSVNTKEEIAARLLAGIKVCKHCGIEKPVSEYQKAGKGRWTQPYCKPCDAERKSKYVEDNKDKVIKKRSSYYQENKAILLDRVKEYRLNNIEKVKARGKRWADSNREYKRQKDREYRDKNANKIDEKQRQKRAANPEYYKAQAKAQRDKRTPEQIEWKRNYDREYKKKNSTKLKSKRKDKADLIRKQKREWQKKRMSDLGFRIKKNLRGRIYYALKGRTRKSDSTTALLGCSIDYFKEYFQSLFTDDMSWEHYLNGEIHIDHIKPCVLFDLTDIEQQKECFNYKNLQPLWWYDNLKKGVNYTEQNK